MIDLQTEQDKAVRCFLVYDAPSGDDSYNLNELEGLTKTLGLICADSLFLKNRKPTARFALGTGKTQEIIDMAASVEADCIVFDFEITPTQQRNWEEQASLPVYDREEIILRIFASRARTKEAVLQVELAKLHYSLPRLAHTYGDMARQRGGSYGSRGSGETQLELDKRAILQKIALIKEDLQKVVKERSTQHKKRERSGILSCAIVGYTNAGKSSLLNALTGAAVYTENALFATLDPTTRKLHLEGGTEILVTDTVGFIRNLPHTLVDSFRSTLEEATRAHVIIILLDSSDMHFESQYKTTLEVLGEIGANDSKKIIVFNKIDAIEDNPFLKSRVDSFCTEYTAIKLSAKKASGFTELIDKIEQNLMGEKKHYHIPLERSDLEALIRRTGIVKSSDWKDDGIYVCAHTSGKTEDLLKIYEV